MTTLIIKAHLSSEELQVLMDEVINLHRDIFRKPLVLQQTDCYVQLKGEYTAHFIEWRDRFFDEDMKILEYKSKSKGNRYTVEELEKMYNKAMLQSPFNCT